MNPSQLRTNLCGLPPTIAFPPASSLLISNGSGKGSSGAVAEPDADDGDTRSLKIWKAQIEERRTMNVAFQRLRWIILRLGEFIDAKASGSGDGEGGGGGDIGGGPAIANTMLNELFGGLVTNTIISLDVIKNNDSSSFSGDEIVANLSIFDLEKLSTNIEARLGKLLGTDSLLLFIHFLSSMDQTDTEDLVSHDNFWRNTLSISGENQRPSSWHELLLLPYKEAAEEILSSYKTIENERDENSLSSLDLPTTWSSVSELEIQNYLLYHASKTLSDIQHFIAPSLEKQKQTRQSQIQTQQRIQNDWQKRYDAAFEVWDDYCMNVLGVESDTLPLFPVGDGMSPDDVMGQYCDQVEECVLGPMRDEFRRLSEQFLRLLVDMDGSTSPEDSSKAKNDEKESVVKCKRGDIVEAIAYYKQFASFASSPQWQGSPTSFDSSKNFSEELSTLAKFTTRSREEVDVKTFNYHSLLAEFVDSPMTRAKLVADLQKLNAFLSSRKRELTRGPSSARSGVAVANAITMEWSRHCIAQSIGSSKSLYRLESISLDDISRFHSAVDNVLKQIVGDISKAKRLRLLADTVGVPAGEKRGTFRFKSRCRKAAELALSMTLCHDQREAGLRALENAQMIKEQANANMRSFGSRVDFIVKGLDGIQLD